MVRPNGTLLQTTGYAQFSPGLGFQQPQRRRGLGGGASWPAACRYGRRRNERYQPSATAAAAASGNSLWSVDSVPAESHIYSMAKPRKAGTARSSSPTSSSRRWSVAAPPEVLHSAALPSPTTNNASTKTKRGRKVTQVQSSAGNTITREYYDGVTLSCDRQKELPKFVNGQYEGNARRRRDRLVRERQRKLAAGGGGNSGNSGGGSGKGGGSKSGTKRKAAPTQPKPTVDGPSISATPSAYRTPTPPRLLRPPLPRMPSRCPPGPRKRKRRGIRIWSLGRWCR